MRYRSVGLLSAGHLFTDLNQGAIPALLPFLIAEHNLSYAAAASIVFATNIASSIVQPIFGHLSDRLGRVWLMPAGILLAGLGVALSGVADSFPLTLAAVAISGIGVSAFHPEGAKLANRLAHENKAMGLSIFAIGGNAGFALGPIVTTAALLYWGLKGTLALAVPAVLVALFLYLQFRDVTTSGCQPPVSSSTTQNQDRWGQFFRLSGIVVARSVLLYGLNTFIPLYWISVLHESAALGGTALTVLFSVGIAGTLLGARLVNHFSHKTVIISGFTALIPLLAIFTSLDSTLWATVLLLPISIALFCIYSPIMVTGQSFLPNRVGLASGVTIGLAVSIGGVAAPFLGWLADGYGIRLALQTLAFWPVLAVLLALGLPSDIKESAKTAAN